MAPAVCHPQPPDPPQGCWPKRNIATCCWEEECLLFYLLVNHQYGSLPLSHTPEPPSVWVYDEHQVHTEVEDITGSSQNHNSEKSILSVAKMILFWTTEHHRSHFQGIADSLLSVPISWVWNIWLYKYLLRAWDRQLLLKWRILLWKRRIAFVYTCHKQFC